MSLLADKQCIPCRGGVPSLDADQIAKFSPQVPDWEVINSHHLNRKYKFPDFQTALAFVIRVGALAEQQGHHPDISFGWGYAELKIWTHAIDGLTESDFILAAKIDRL
jgi:4a-hydroxytetrahydrobiopterin dehydratase